MQKKCPPQITNNPLRIFIELLETVKNVQTFFACHLCQNVCAAICGEKGGTLTIPIKLPIICLIFWPFFSFLVLQY